MPLSTDAELWLDPSITFSVSLGDLLGTGPMRFPLLGLPGAAVYNDGAAVVRVAAGCDVADLENVAGGAGDDRLTGNDADNVLDGLSAAA